MLISFSLFSRKLSKDIVQKTLKDHQTAAIPEKVRITLNLLEKLTLTPDLIEVDDFLPLREAGISDQAIEDALYVSAFFQIINRLADAFAVTIPSEEMFMYGAARLLKDGYL